MKNFIISIALVLAALSTLGSCSGCSRDKDRETDTVPTFVKADTTEVLHLTEQYLNYVRDKDYDKAIAMLNTIVDDTARPVSEETERDIRAQQRAFPVLAYKVADMEFVNENRVKVTYEIEFFKKNPGDKIPNTIRLTFAPQRINAQWYLELLERSVVK